MPARITPPIVFSSTAGSLSFKQRAYPLPGEWVHRSSCACAAPITNANSRLQPGSCVCRASPRTQRASGDTTATERIGWDPVSREIKSWTFDSQDGRGEGRWKQDGTRWLVETKEVMGDGQEASTVAVVTPSDGNYVWEVKSSKISKQDLPKRHIKFTRAPEVE